MIIELDCAKFTDRATVHAYLMEKFSFPDYYGKNLDALYDLLTCESRELTIRIINSDLIEAYLGGYGSALLGTIREAGEDNPKLEIILS